MNLQEYYVDICKKDTLVITLGESWTYGDSLDEEHRRSQIYGRLIANALDADYINIARCGASNSWILKRAQQVIKRPDLDSYKNVYIVFTFTESGRDFERKSDWLVNYTSYYEDYQDNITIDFYDQIFNDLEDTWTKTLDTIVNNLPKNVQVVLGQNFPWHEHFYSFDYGNKVLKLEKNWIEAISNEYKLASPPRARFVTGWVWNLMTGINDILSIDDTSVYKMWTLDKLDSALKVNEWLDTSPVNLNKTASKHPNPTGHKIWADYIVKQIRE